MDASQVKNAEERMKKAVETIRHEVASVRTNKATTSLLDGIKVEYYGNPTPLTQVASVSAPEARLLVIQPWERSTITEIARVPRPAADLRRLKEWFVYLNRQESYLVRIADELRREHTIKAQRLTARFIHNGNLANNVASLDETIAARPDPWTSVTLDPAAAPAVPCSEVVATITYGNSAAGETAAPNPVSRSRTQGLAFSVVFGHHGLWLCAPWISGYETDERSSFPARFRAPRHRQPALPAFGLRLVQPCPMGLAGVRHLVADLKPKQPKKDCRALHIGYPNHRYQTGYRRYCRAC